MTSVTERDSQSVTKQAKEQVQEAAQQAKSQSREQLRAQISERSTQVGDQAAAAAKAVRRASEQLRSEGNDRAANAIDAVADRGERLGAYLRRADGDQILRDVEDFARNQPWLMVGGSAVAGFLAARFMKATSHERFRGAEMRGHRSSANIASGRPGASTAETRVSPAGGNRNELR